MIILNSLLLYVGKKTDLYLLSYLLYTIIGICTVIIATIHCFC